MTPATPNRATKESLSEAANVLLENPRVQRKRVRVEHLRDTGETCGGGGDLRIGELSTTSSSTCCGSGEQAVIGADGRIAASVVCEPYDCRDGWIGHVECDPFDCTLYPDQMQCHDDGSGAPPGGSGSEVIEAPVECPAEIYPMYNRTYHVPVHPFLTTTVPFEVSKLVRYQFATWKPHEASYRPEPFVTTHNGFRYEWMDRVVHILCKQYSFLGISWVVYVNNGIEGHALYLP